MTNPAGSLRTEAERNLALLAYGLLAASIFFAGVTALVAVIIAYALHDAANDQLASHFRFQIRIFWVALGLAMLATVTAVAGGLLFFHDIAATNGGWQGLDLDREIVRQIAEYRYSWTSVGLLLASVGCLVLGLLWIVIAPSVGFIRLATSRHMGETARP